MALRDQPYLPLYVQDFLTDEKLSECSMEATGLLAKLMCLMHKSDPYGVILLKEKDKQTSNQIENFASKLAKHFPWSENKIKPALAELLAEGVVYFDGDSLCQKRMIHDCKISETRRLSGQHGGKQTQSKIKDFASNFAKGKSKANTEYENEYENENVIDIESEKRETKTVEEKPKKVKQKSKPILVDPDPLENPFSQQFFEGTWQKWKIFRKDLIKKQIDPGSSENAALKLLWKDSDGNEQTALEIIERSIAAKWQGLFALDRKSGSNGLVNKNGRFVHPDYNMSPGLKNKTGMYNPKKQGDE